MGTSGEYVYFSAYQQVLTFTNFSQTNILVNNQFNACIADLGLAQLVSVANQQGNGSSISRSGSLRWMAPELLGPVQTSSGHELQTRASDIWAFGMVVYVSTLRSLSCMQSNGSDL